MRDILQFSAVAVALLVAFPVPSFAGSTEWLETNGGNVRIVMAPIENGATVARGMIDIDLVEGWKTYWRDPGDGGIPPSIIPTDTDRYPSVDLQYPAPTAFAGDFGAGAGYDAPVQIPFTIQAVEPITDTSIDVRLMVGICEEICIPAFADFALPIAIATGSTASLRAVQQASAALPEAPSALGVDLKIAKGRDQSVSVTLSGDLEGLEVFASGGSNEQFRAPKIVEKSDQIARYVFMPIREFKTGSTVDLFVTGRTKRGTFESMETLEF